MVRHFGVFCKASLHRTGFAETSRIVNDRATGKFAKPYLLDHGWNQYLSTNGGGGSEDGRGWGRIECRHLECLVIRHGQIGKQCERRSKVGKERVS